MRFSKNFIVFIHGAGYTLVSSGAFCQNTTAPYSIYGIGDIDKQVYNRTNGIGSTAGIELSKKVQRWGQTIEKNYFQLGGFINNSYLEVNNTPINEFGITAGTGGALTNNLLYTISIGSGKRGTTNANLIRENFFQFSVSLTYRDFLASKGRKYE